MSKRHRSAILATAVVVLLSTTSQYASAQCILSDDFSTGIEPWWTTSRESVISAVDGALDINFVTNSQYGNHWVELNTCSYVDFDASFRMRDLDGTTNKVFQFRSYQLPEVFTRFGYRLNFRSSSYNDVVLSEREYGAVRRLASGSAPHSTNQWIDVRVQAVGPTITVWMNGSVVLSYTDENPLGEGTVMLVAPAGASLAAHVQFDDFAIQPVGVVPSTSSSWGAVKTRY